MRQVPLLARDARVASRLRAVDTLNFVVGFLRSALGSG